MPAMPKFGFHRIQLRLQPLHNRLPKDRVPPVPLLPADVREAQEVEGLRLAPTFAPAVLDRERSELQQACLVGVQFQVEREIASSPVAFSQVKTPE